MKKIHDQYGKSILKAAFGEDYIEKPQRRQLLHDGQPAGSITIDGELFGHIAIEVESRVSKQVRGAILDLILHPFPIKMLILIEAHGNQFTAPQARYIFERFGRDFCWAVVQLQGSGTVLDTHFRSDVELIQKEVQKLLSSQRNDSGIEE